MITFGPFGFECFEEHPGTVAGPIEVVPDVHCRGMFDDWPPRRFRRLVMSKDLSLVDFPRRDLLAAMQYSFESPFVDKQTHGRRPSIVVEMVHSEGGECRRYLARILGVNGYADISRDNGASSETDDAPRTTTIRAHRTR